MKKPQEFLGRSALSDGRTWVVDADLVFNTRLGWDLYLSSSIPSASTTYNVSAISRPSSLSSARALSLPFHELATSSAQLSSARPIVRRPAQPWRRRRQRLESVCVCLHHVVASSDTIVPPAGPIHAVRAPPLLWNVDARVDNCSAQQHERRRPRHWHWQSQRRPGTAQPPFEDRRSGSVGEPASLPVSQPTSTQPSSVPSHALRIPGRTRYRLSRAAVLCTYPYRPERIQSTQPSRPARTGL